MGATIEVPGLIVVKLMLLYNPLALGLWPIFMLTIMVLLCITLVAMNPGWLTVMIRTLVWCAILGRPCAWSRATAIAVPLLSSSPDMGSFMTPSWLTIMVLPFVTLMFVVPSTPTTFPGA